jgi:hypothetical protein
MGVSKDGDTAKGATAPPKTSLFVKEAEQQASAEMKGLLVTAKQSPAGSARKGKNANKTQHLQNTETYREDYNRVGLDELLYGSTKKPGEWLRVLLW